MRSIVAVFAAARRVGEGGSQRTCTRVNDRKTNGTALGPLASIKMWRDSTDQLQ